MGSPRQCAAVSDRPTLRRNLQRQGGCISGGIHWCYEASCASPQHSAVGCENVYGVFAADDQHPSRKAQHRAGDSDCIWSPRQCAAVSDRATLRRNLHRQEGHRCCNTASAVSQMWTNNHTVIEVGIWHIWHLLQASSTPEPKANTGNTTDHNSVYSHVLSII